MIDQKPFDIKYLPLRVSLVSLKQAELPDYLGSTLRGIIGQFVEKLQKYLNEC